MATIIERAKQFRNSKEKEFGVTDLTGVEIGYIRGASRQRRIDIRKAQKIVCVYCDNPLCYNYHIGDECEKLNNVRRKMMEE